MSITKLLNGKKVAESNDQISLNHVDCWNIEGNNMAEIMQLFLAEMNFYLVCSGTFQHPLSDTESYLKRYESLDYPSISISLIDDFFDEAEEEKGDTLIVVGSKHNTSDHLHLWHGSPDEKIAFLLDDPDDDEMLIELNYEEGFNLIINKLVDLRAQTAN